MLLLGLAIILISCELFTNGIEWLGKRLRLGDGVVGSVFSAVGTCLPETMIPIIAILFSNGSENSMDIGIGAIMGAPFMLSTLAFFITGASVLVFWKRRKTGMKMQVNNVILARDIGFFMIVYTIGIAAAFIKLDLAKVLISILLVAIYIYYIVLTVKQDNESHSSIEKLYASRYLKVKTNMSSIAFQVALALGGIVIGAHVFVKEIELVAEHFGISALILSLIVAPIATELPEKFNSIIWVSRKKDTLAMGNITGAMVFQSCIPVAIGVYFTNWELDNRVIFSGLLSIAAAGVVYLWIKLKGSLSPQPLIAGGVFYMIFIGYLI